MPVDPRLLSDQQLQRQHALLHLVLTRHLTPRRRSLLTLRHELVRVALIRRRGSVDFRDNHDTPVNHDALSDRAHAALLLYERHALDDTPPQQQQRYFDRLLSCFQKES